MKLQKLTIAPRAGKRSFQVLEQELGYELDEDFKEFMTMFAGLSVLEDIFIDERGTDWEIQSFDNVLSIRELTIEFKTNGWGLKIPFAYDPGGWHFCLSYDKESFKKVIVNRWTDHSPEEQFLVIADSFEEFINGLNKRENTQHSV